MASEDKGAGLAFFLAGAALGAALGVLYATKPGRETRDQLADWLSERRESGTELLKKIKAEYPNRKEQVVSALKAGKRAVTETVKNGKEALKS